MARSTLIAFPSDSQNKSSAATGTTVVCEDDPALYLDYIIVSSTVRVEIPNRPRPISLNSGGFAGHLTGHFAGHLTGHIAGHFARRVLDRFQGRCLAWLVGRSLGFFGCRGLGFFGCRGLGWRGCRRLGQLGFRSLRRCDCRSLRRFDLKVTIFLRKVERRNRQWAYSHWGFRMRDQHPCLPETQPRSRRPTKKVLGEAIFQWSISLCPAKPV